MKAARLFLLLPVASALGFQAPGASEPAVEVRRLSDRIVILNVEGLDPHNIVAMKTRKGIVVVDTEVGPVFAGAIRKRIKEEFGDQAVRYVINTHAHGDHTYGNQVFEDADIIGHEGCLREMAGFAEEAVAEVPRFSAFIERLQTRLEAADPCSETAESLRRQITYYSFFLDGIKAGFSPTPPNVTFSDRMNLDLGDLTLELVYFGNAHSGSDILVYCPQEKLLLTGDLFYPRMFPPYWNTGHITELDRWVSSLSRFLEQGRELEEVVAGHKNALNNSHLADILAYLKSERERIAGKANAFPHFEKAAAEAGIERALDRLQDMMRSPDEYFILEGDFVSKGYECLYQEKDAQSAQTVFKVLTEVFPDSWNAYDCLGEAHMAAGHTAEAIRYYTKSLELNPDNDNARSRLARLESERRRQE